MFSFQKDHTARIQSLILFLSLIVIIAVSACQGAEAYYGLGLYGGGISRGYGLYGLGGLYGGLGGLYGLSGLSSLYGLGGLSGLSGLGSLYGSGGLYGLSGLGSLYGSGGLSGLSGLSSPYGLSGLYGLGGLSGLSGLSSLYGLGGLSGLSGLGSLYGLGMYGGLGSLYGVGGLYGLGGFSGGLGGLSMIGLAYGLGGSSGLKNLQTMAGLSNSLNPLGGLGLLNLGAQSPALTNLVGITAEQAGTWTGTWYSLIKLNAGIMNMTLVEDAVNGVLTGEVTLILNKITKSLPAEVSGPYAGGDTFVLTGGNSTILLTTLVIGTTLPLYEIELTCTLTSPTTMTGTYLINDLVKLLDYDYGNFDLTLSTPVI